MPLMRKVSLTLLTLLASLWAGSLVVFGLLLASRGVSGWITSSTGIGGVAWRGLGIALICGGSSCSCSPSQTGSSPGPAGAL